MFEDACRSKQAATEKSRSHRAYICKWEVMAIGNDAVVVAMNGKDRNIVLSFYDVEVIDSTPHIDDSSDGEWCEEFISRTIDATQV